MNAELFLNAKTKGHPEYQPDFISSMEANAKPCSQVQRMVKFKITYFL